MTTTKQQFLARVRQERAFWEAIVAEVGEGKGLSGWVGAPSAPALWMTLYCTSTKSTPR
jgi:hypothetical protein